MNVKWSFRNAKSQFRRVSFHAHRAIRQYGNSAYRLKRASFTKRVRDRSFAIYIDVVRARQSYGFSNETTELARPTNVKRYSDRLTTLLAIKLPKRRMRLSSFSVSLALARTRIQRVSGALNAPVPGRRNRIFLRRALSLRNFLLPSRVTPRHQ